MDINLRVTNNMRNIYSWEVSVVCKPLSLCGTLLQQPEPDWHRKRDVQTSFSAWIYRLQRPIDQNQFVTLVLDGITTFFSKSQSWCLSWLQFSFLMYTNDTKIQYPIWNFTTITSSVFAVHNLLARHAFIFYSYNLVVCWHLVTFPFNTFSTL